MHASHSCPLMCRRYNNAITQDIMFRCVIMETNRQASLNTNALLRHDLQSRWYGFVTLWIHFAILISKVFRYLFHRFLSLFYLKLSLSRSCTVGTLVCALAFSLSFTQSSHKQVLSFGDYFPVQVCLSSLLSRVNNGSEVISCTCSIWLVKPWQRGGSED